MKCPSCGKSFDAFAAEQYRTSKGLYVKCPTCKEQIFVGKTSSGVKTRRVSK